jgi:nitroreductase
MSAPPAAYPPRVAALFRDVVAHAVLAPSSHNTQPWSFRIEEGTLELYADRSRSLRVNDPEDRELTISCGAALLTARVAAAHLGASLDVALLPDGDDADLLARATPCGVPGPDARLFPAVAERRTYRGAFADAVVSPEGMGALAQAAATEGAGLRFLDGRRRAAFRALVEEGDRRQFADAAWRAELATWIRPRRRGDGLALSPAAAATRFVVRHRDLGERVARRDSALADRADLVALLSTQGDGVADWLTAGQALQRVLLTATLAGLQASFLNQPLQVPELRCAAGDLLDAGGYAQIALRLGVPVRRLRSTPRRPVAAVLRPTAPPLRPLDLVTHP